MCTIKFNAEVSLKKSSFHYITFRDGNLFQKNNSMNDSEIHLAQQSRLPISISGPYLFPDVFLPGLTGGWWMVCVASCYIACVKLGGQNCYEYCSHLCRWKSPPSAEAWSSPLWMALRTPLTNRSRSSALSPAWICPSPPGPYSKPWSKKMTPKLAVWPWPTSTTPPAKPPAETPRS